MVLNMTVKQNSGLGSSSYDPSSKLHDLSAGLSGGFGSLPIMDVSKQSASYSIEAPGNYGGDLVEKIGWQVFGKLKFFNYESYWVKFVVPNTGRPLNINPKLHYDKDVQEISQMSYSIFKCFTFVYQNSNSICNLDSFETCYIKLGKIIDTVEQLLLKFVIYKKLVKYEDLKGQVDRVLEDKDTMQKKIESLKKSSIGYLEKSKNLSISILNKIDVVKQFFRINEDLFGKIKGYRNVIIHGSPLFQVSNTMVPTKGTILNFSGDMIDYKDWGVYFEKLNSPTSSQFIKENFVDMKLLLIEDLGELMDEINMIFGQINQKML